MGRQGGVWAAFLAMSFLIVGLVGGFALYGAPVPLQRALAVGATLDAVLVAGESPDAPAKLAALRPALGDDAGAVLDGPGTLADRVAHARAAVREQAEQEEAAVTARVRLMLVVVTLMAALFGIGVMGLARRS
jgi:hypothetical protein